MPALRKRILLCGHRAFAAQGLAQLLEMEGHAVTCFSRGEPGKHASCVTGSVSEMHFNRLLGPMYDTIVNYIVLRHESVEHNLDYLHALLETCHRCAVQHLIHFSSVSAYRDDVSLYTEDAPTKDNIKHSGPYAALKIAADQYLMRHLPQTVKLSLVRPACVLGENLPDPVGSVGWPLGSGRILVLGAASRIRPVVCRDVLNRVIARLAADPPRDSREVLLAVDRNSPTCREYLQACCDLLGAGTRVVDRPPPFWIAALLKRELRSGRPAFSMQRFVRSVRQRCRQQSYNPGGSEERVGFGFTADWRQALRGGAVKPASC
jgi:nucleoside-diphosphate-sugar epimerase